MRKYKAIAIAVFLLYFMIQALPIKNIKALELSNNIILLIDNSGSMRKTDPNRLSVVAASMLIDTLEENTNLNIITFGDKAMASHKLSDKPSKQILKEELQRLKFDSNNTNLKEGIKEALSQFEGVEGEKTIIVLSDGKEDPVGGVNSEHMKELYSLSDIAHDTKVKIHCIGLSQYADEEALSKITFKTGGDYFPCDNPAQLFNIFSKVLGNLNSFYTIEQFTTDMKKEREIKLSSYIEEVTIKIASCDNKSPMVDVTLDGKELSTNKIEDKYKIYRFNNNKNSSINITARDEGKNSVIVQIKSKSQIDINSSSDNFSIPFKIPMSIEASINMSEEIKGLHMDKLEGGKREGIERTGDIFKFSLSKEEAGQYPLLLTAYDGDGNIIAVKDININVKGYPPFYYTSELPDTIVTEKSYRVELKQQNDSKVDKPSGEIYVDYGDKYERFLLKYENGMLYSDIILDRPGQVKITTQLNGVKDNENFSYYLPYLKTEVVEKAYVEIQSEKNKQPFKVGGDVKLSLNIVKNCTYENEKIFIYDDKNNEVGELQLTPNTKGVIAVPIKIKEKGDNLSFNLKPEKDVRVTSRIDTDLRVLSRYYYPIYKVRIPLIIIGILALIAALFIGVGQSLYIKKIKNHCISKTLYYNIGSNYDRSLSLNLRYAKGETTRYLNVSNNSVSIEQESDDNTIGYFILKAPLGVKFIEGWRYVLNKNKYFFIEYVTLDEQEVYFNNESIAGRIVYKSDIEVQLKKGKNLIIISFS
jgi:uncharacterized protein YegL